MRNIVVIDTSIVIKWVFDEPNSDIAQALLAEWINKGTKIIAPSLLAYEVANVLYKNVRKGEITLKQAKLALTKILLSELKINFSPDPDLGVQALELADRYKLSAAYDPHYLALAEREGCEFWTADLRMRNTIGGKIDWVRYLSDYNNSTSN